MWVGRPGYAPHSPGFLREVPRARDYSCSRPTNVNSVASGGQANRTGV
jgi:hypothetical protein